MGRDKGRLSRRNYWAALRAFTCLVRWEIFRAAVRQCSVPLAATRAMMGVALRAGMVGKGLDWGLWVGLPPGYKV